MRIEVMRGHTKSLDGNDKLIQTRSHERDTIASRKRQVEIGKVKSTIPALSGVLAHLYQQSLSHCITCQNVCVQHSTGTCGNTPNIVTESEH